VNRTINPAAACQTGVSGINNGINSQPCYVSLVQFNLRVQNRNPHAVFPVRFPQNQYIAQSEIVLQSIFMV
jgi:hypothetical protein